MSFFTLNVIENNDEVYIESYETKDGQVVQFSKDEDVINLEPLRPYIGKVFDRFINGAHDGTYRLIDISATPVPTNENGEVLYNGEEEKIIDALIFDVV